MTQYMKFKDEEQQKINLFLSPDLKPIINKIISIGGYPYLVGGAVVDLLCKEEPKDWDIEVFRVSYEQLQEVLSEFGQPDLIGNKFGIIKLKTKHLDLEFSIPRRENRNGLKHQDFNIELVPDLSLKEAARRRDFTINTIYLNLKTNKIYDPFDGRYYLNKGKLCHVDRTTFKEDPLRVFRGLQILGRKLRVSVMSHNELVQEMVANKELDSVPGEAIFGEMNKLFSKATNFGYSALYLERTNLLSFFPELKRLDGCEQNEKWHPEGDVWKHTKLVVEEAFKYRDELPEEWKLPFMWGMLLHDIGKPDTYDPVKKTSYGHDDVGAKLAQKFMERFTNNPDFIKKVVSIVKGHMRGRLLIKSRGKKGSWRKLQNICRLDVLSYVSMCDSDGRHPTPKEGKEGEFKIMMAHWKDLGSPEDKIPAILMGRHLIERGLKPGPEFGPLLAIAYKYQIKTGETDVDRLYRSTKSICSSRKQ